MTTYVNPNAYTFNPSRKRHQVTLTIVTDMVPGWGHTIEDHIKKAFENAYVVSATIEENKP